MRAELEQLRILLIVTEAGSFTAAAAQRNADVSAISRAIHDLEQRIGVSLFERLPGGVRLTDAGQSYVASARDILERHEQAALHARRAARLRSLHLSLGFVWSETSKHMVELLRTFATDLPTISVNLVEAGNDELIAKVRSDRLDAAITATDPPPFPRLKVVPHLASMPLWLESIAAVLPTVDELRSLDWSDLACKRLLCRATDDWPRFVRHVERMGGPTLVFEPHAVSQEGVLGLVAAGLGWTLIPTSFSHLLPNDLRVVPITSVGTDHRPRCENGALVFITLMSDSDQFLTYHLDDGTDVPIDMAVFRALDEASRA